MIYEHVVLYSYLIKIQTHTYLVTFIQNSNKLIFEPRPSRAMSNNPNDGSTAINNGIVTIKVNVNRSNGDNAINNAVIDKLSSVFGVGYPTALADYIMFCHPPDTLGGGIAYAYINSWLSVYNNKWCSSLSGGLHEVSICRQTFDIEMLVLQYC